MRQCPWHGFEPATIKFCEEELCSWITQPSNTWSNVGFLIVGVLILRHSRRERHSGLSLIGISAIVVGLGSALFHASSTFFFEFFDLLGMFMISGLLVCFNAQRLFGFTHRTATISYLALTAASLILMLLWRPSGIATFAVQIAIALTFEMLAHLRRDQIHYLSFLKMVAAFSIAFIFWVLDVSGILCEPGNHILSGHAVWHLLNAVAIWFIYQFYIQFKRAKRGTFTLEKAE